ncbi:TrmB family transcriptional regulator [Halorarum halobium]|uniref:TrmB family transcriptional regulator n=1 Tax=Halorarum halobium TaxID=3075121 RepID=UPI0028AAD8F0|nr:TrmB family transcriptional regulator [Halobaculum sp. XH14]
MSQVELSATQRRILATLLEEYESAPVKGEIIADALDRTAGSTRNEFRSLKALGLIEGIPGPKGGYKPTAAAYDVLSYQDLEEPERLVLAHEHDRVSATVDTIDLIDVGEPDRCRARIHFQEAVDGLAVGDPVVVGPTPVSKLVVVGAVEAVAETADEVVLDVGAMEAPFSDG